MNKKKESTKKGKMFRGAAAFIAAAMLSALAPAFMPAAADNVYAAETTEALRENELPRELMNGDFELPDIYNITHDSNGDYQNSYTYNGKTYSIKDESVEDTSIQFRQNNPWFVAKSSTFDALTDNNFYWKTTAYNDEIELVSGTEGSQNLYFGSYAQNVENTSGSGEQFAELVSTEISSLYQDIATDGGETLTWSLMHRGRTNTDEQYEGDSMAVFIGPRQTDVKKTGSGDNVKDIFMIMAEYLTNNNDDSGSDIFGRTIYSKKITPGEVLDESFVSLNPGGEYTEQWTCWIITDDESKWNTYNGQYRVPEGQTETTLAFTALNASGASGGTENQSNEGNCLDNIQFGVLYPLSVKAVGGSGTVSYTHVGGNVETNVTPQSGYSANLEKDKAVIVKANAVKGYTFVGARVDGDFLSRDKFIENNDGSYSYADIKMDQGHEVVLYFAENGKVTYDPNGGTFAPEDTSPKPEYEDALGVWTYEFTAFANAAYQTEPPQLEGSSFLGWRVFAIDGSEVEGVLVGAEHGLRYDSSNITLYYDKTIDENNHSNWEYCSLEASSDDAVLLVAVYEHEVTVQPCTRSFGENKFNDNDDTGGTVTISKDNAVGSSVNVKLGDNYFVSITAKPGYKVEEIRYEYADRPGELQIPPIEIADDTYTAEFTSDSNITIHVHFSEKPIEPYLSVVPENDAAAGILSEKGLVTGVKSSDGTAVGEYGGYGGTRYGNTVSTGFFLERSFDNSANTSGIWTINIPANGTYIKVADGKFNENDYPHLNDIPVVEDETNTEDPNKGAIYEASDNAGEHNYNRQIKLYVESQTTITNGTAVFGIVIDNLYSPNAQAGFKVTQDKENAIVLDNDNSVYADDYEDFVTNQDILNKN